MATPTPSSQHSAPSKAPSVGDSISARVDVLNTDGGRILCVADVRGGISTLNQLAADHSAIAIIHSGDFGFYEPSSLSTISDRTLKHLVQYSSLISPQFRSQLLSPSTTPAQTRELLAHPPKAAFPDPSEHAFGLSEFPELLAGELKLNVPVYAVWGACEDVAILEKIRLAPPSAQTPPSDPSKIAPSVPQTTSRPQSISATPPSYSIPNLTVLDEATTRVLLIGGVRLRLFGLGGAVVPHKLFDNGSGTATIAGGQGTMWTTMLQIGELVDTAQKVYDPSETRLLISHASPGREGLIAQLALVLKADLTVSAGLHFRYGVSYNEFSVQHDPEAFRGKLEAARKSFNDVWDAVRGQVESVVDESQRALLSNALAVANRVPTSQSLSGGTAIEETAWKNCWNWNLPDAAFGALVLDIREGRVGSELKSQGFNFAYRQNTPKALPSAAPVPANATSTAPLASVAPSTASIPAPTPSAPSAPTPTPSANATATPTPAPASSSPAPTFNNISAARPPPTNQFQGRPSPHNNHNNLPPHQRAPSGPRGGGGRGGFAGQGGWNLSNAASAAAAVASVTSAGQGAPHQQLQYQQQQQQAPSAPAGGPSGATPPTAPKESRSQTPKPLAPHQQQQQQQQQQAPATAPAASTTTATNSDSTPVPSRQSASSPITAAVASTDAAAAGESSGAEGTGGEGGGRGPRPPRGEGGGRGGGGGGARGRGTKGRSDGEWRGRGPKKSRSGGGGGGGGGGEATPGGGGGESKPATPAPAAA